jgi:hypothetical protein
MLGKASGTGRGRWSHQACQRGERRRPLRRGDHRVDSCDLPFRTSGALPHCGSALHNLSVLLYQLGRHADAHERLDHARRIFTRLNDSGAVAQVDETQARACSWRRPIIPRLKRSSPGRCACSGQAASRRCWRTRWPCGGSYSAAGRVRGLDLDAAGGDEDGRGGGGRRERRARGPNARRRARRDAAAG